ncbi:sensor domain-containing protein [Brevibacillus fluminis]|uniref:sensor domain-containing protein n=1 Tax=Brevibacillus fluminis TaxID=511487 RepID=UPI003F8C5F9B
MIALPPSARSREKASFFTIMLDSNAYRSLAYLLLSFPLGIFYFVFAIACLALSIGLTPVFLIGLPILLLFLLAANLIMDFEIGLIRYVLGVRVDYSRWQSSSHSSLGLVKRCWAYATHPRTMKSVLLLLIKFPIGILSFVISITFIAVSLSLLFSPLLYFIEQTTDQSTTQIILFDETMLNVFHVDGDPFLQTWIYAIVGFFLTFISLHLFTYLAQFFSKIVMLFAEE